MNSPNRDGYNTSYLSARLRLWSSRAWPRSGRFRERLADSPLCYNPGVISRADLASGPAVPSTTSRLQSASTSTPLSPLGPALTSFLSASPSLSASAPGVAELSASQSTLRRRLSSPALASSLSSGPRS